MQQSERERSTTGDEDEQTMPVTLLHPPGCIGTLAWGAQCYSGIKTEECHEHDGKGPG